MTRIRRLVTRRAERGAAAVEMALVLPMLLFVVFGIIDFGRLLNAQITLTEAAREGARAAAMGQTVGTPCPAGNPTAAYVDCRVQAASGNLKNVTEVSPTQGCVNPNDDATVTTSYDLMKDSLPIVSCTIWHPSFVRVAGTLTISGADVRRADHERITDLLRTLGGGCSAASASSLARDASPGGPGRSESAAASSPWRPSSSASAC